MNKLIVQTGVALMLLCVVKWAFAAQQALTAGPCTQGLIPLALK